MAVQGMAGAQRGRGWEISKGADEGSVLGGVWFPTVGRGFADELDVRDRKEPRRTQKFGSEELEQWSFLLLRLADPKES